MTKRRARGGERARRSAEPQLPSGSTPSPLDQLARSAELISTRVWQQRAHATDAALQQPQVEASVQVAGIVRDVHDADDNRLVIFSLGVLVTTPGFLADGGEPAIVIEVHRLMSFVNVPKDVERADLETFCKTTVAFMAWPLLRADVLALASSLGMSPPLLLPVMRAKATLVGGGGAVLVTTPSVKPDSPDGEAPANVGGTVAPG